MDRDRIMRGDPNQWHIHYDPKPIPDRSHDYSFYHDDHDGENGLCGTAGSVAKAWERIEEMEET